MFCTAPNNLSTMKKRQNCISYESIGLLLAVVAFIIIFILEFMKFCPLGVWKTIRRCVLALSYNYVAAVIFYIIITLLPARQRCEIIRKRTNGLFLRLKDLARICKQSVNPAYIFTDSVRPTREEYVKQFSETDLNQKDFISGEKTLCRYLEELKEKMTVTLDYLLLYQEALTVQELDMIVKIQKSFFISNPISVINFDIPEEYRATYPNYQQEIGESIFDIYEWLTKAIPER